MDSQLNNILIVALEYLEPEWQETKACIESTGLPVTYVSRDGVGNMSRAFNSAINCYSLLYYDCIWFVTNITFDKNVPFVLKKEMEENNWSAIHPAMKSSDHQHLWPTSEAKKVPFIEWTAPMVDYSVFLKFGLDEKLPYFYMDLDWSFRVKADGHKLGVSTAEISHTYLRNRSRPHMISEIRKHLRNYWTPISQEHMKEKHGENWKQLMQWKG